MRTALILAMISILGLAVGRFETHKDANANTVPIKVLKVRIVKDPLITADMLSPTLAMHQGPAESTVASLETR